MQPTAGFISIKFFTRGRRNSAYIRRATNRACAILPGARQTSLGN